MYSQRLPRGRYSGGMAETAQELLNRIPNVSAAEAAERLGIEPHRIKQLLSERTLLALRVQGGPRILEETLIELPAAEQFVAEVAQKGSDEPRLVRVTHEPLKGLRGTVLLLEDGGFSPEETVAWLWSPNEELEGRPIDLLVQGSHKRVNRVASALAW